MHHLVQEIFVEAGVLFHMYQGYEFLEQAEHFLKLEEKPDIVEEAKEVTQQNTMEVYDEVPSTVTEYRAKQVIYTWLKTQYPQSKIRVNRHEIPEFVLIEPDNTFLGFEIKYYRKPTYFVDSTLHRILYHFRQNVKNINAMQLNIVIVTDNISIAEKLIEKIGDISYISEKISLIVGYLEADNQFCPVTRLTKE